MRISRKVSATIIGTPTFIIQVSDALPAGAELVPGHEDAVAHAVGHVGQALERLAVEQVAGDALDAVALQRLAQARFAEARHADHAPLGRRALGHARQRRAHLAADAEHDDVAIDARQVGHEPGRGLAHEVFEGFDVGEALRQCGHVRDSQAAMPSKRSRPSLSARILASAIERFSIQKPQSGWM